MHRSRRHMFYDGVFDNIDGMTYIPLGLYFETVVSLKTKHDPTYSPSELVHGTVNELRVATQNFTSYHRSMSLML